ncbi:MAG: 50S ribosomal protein L30 [Candidatus Thermoplasmatota archaeon]|jgi:large subunit ribosomal protein L30|nr:50S ribosomal protein L30 [Candidatus Thermoplasmatota archaeon]MCL5955651.1 50S ribosomal protein L30 [Candidatus Thermoplasmatota archaeon]
MLAVIRIRGETGIRPQAAKTTSLLRLHRVNHMVLVEDNEINKGMLKVAKDYVTWGEVEDSTVELVLKHRSQLKGREYLDEESLEETTGFKSYKDLANALQKGKVKYKDIKDIVPVVRLNPPKGGYEAIRKPFNQGGSAGYRGKDINRLILTMLKPGVDLNGTNEN